MTCKNCGTNIPETETKCPTCGAENTDETEYISAAGAERAIPKGFSAKKNIIIIIIAAVILLIGGTITAAVLTNSNFSNSSTSETLQLAERYLSEQNYEQAVIEFQKVLEIEPMNVEAYLGLADTYMALGETDKAVETFEKGISETDNERLKDRLREIQESEKTKTTEPEYSVHTETTDTQTEPNEIKSVSAALETTVELTVPAETKPVETKPVQTEPAETASTSTFQATTVEITFEETTINETKPVQTESTQTNSVETNPPVYTSVTILGFKYDIETTTELQLINKKINDETLKEITPNIKRLTNLKVLYLNANQITDITPLTPPTNLTELSLHNNQITDITPITQLNNLKELALSMNQITDISPLAQLTNLTELQLHYNQITDLTPLIGLTNLTDLYLSYNQIPEFQIDQLKSQLPNCEIIH